MDLEVLSTLGEKGKGTDFVSPSVQLHTHKIRGQISKLFRDCWSQLEAALSDIRSYLINCFINTFTDDSPEVQI